MSEYVRQPLKEWCEVIAEKDAEIKRLRGAITDALFELEENYFQRASAILYEAVTEGMNEMSEEHGKSHITIPPEAIEAAKSAYTAEIYRGNGTAREYHEAMRAACLAMLQNWPGLSHVYRDWDNTPLVCLPLPTEKQSG